MLLRKIKKYFLAPKLVYRNKELLDKLLIQQENLNNQQEYISGEQRKAESHNYIVEKELMRMYKLLEYQLFQNRIQNNLFQYRKDCSTKKYDSRYNPLVSIIIPAYNGANYIKEAIESALNQTYSNIEIIVVNDGSNDKGKTEKIVNSYGKKVKYFYKENGGVSSALNYGIKQMKGEYFAWLSHDDKYYPNHIETLIDFLRYNIGDKGEKLIGYTCFDIIDEKSRINKDHSITSLLYTADYLTSLNTKYACILKGDINGGNILIPKEAFDKCGYFEEGNRVSQEKDMWSRLIKEYRLINIPIITSSIRIHDNQVTNNTSNIRDESTKKFLQIINDLDEKDMIEESGSIDKFYYDLYTYYGDNGYEKLSLEMYKRYESFLKEKNRK